MAVNKAMLINLLMNSAPMLLGALQKPYYAPGEFYHGDDPLSGDYENIGNLNNVTSRGYDMGIVEDDMLNDFKSPHILDDWGMTDSAQYVLSKTALAANRANNPQHVHFPGDAVEADDLLDLSYDTLKSTSPAAASAAVFQQPRASRGIKALAQNLLGKFKNKPF